MHTVANVKAGGRTRISGALHALIPLSIELVAGPVASDIPKAVLAGILIKIGADIVDWEYLRRINDAPRSSAIIMFIVFGLTVAVYLLLAAGVGMVMTNFLFMVRMTDIQIAGISTITIPDEEAPLSEEETEITREANGQIIIFHLSGPMSFSSAKAMATRHAATAGYSIMLLDLTEVPSLDFASARAIEDIIVDTNDSGREIFLVGARNSVCEMLEKQRVTRHFNTGHMYHRGIDTLHLAKTLLNEESA